VQAWLGPQAQQDKRKNEEIRIGLANFVTFSKTSQPLTVCECPLLLKLLQTCWDGAKLPSHHTFRPYIIYQYLVFKLILQIELKVCLIFYSGTAFAQGMHDGGTLKNFKKYENFALKFITPFHLQFVVRILKVALADHNPATDRLLTVAELFERPSVVKSIHELRTSAAALNFTPLNISVFFAPQGVTGTAQAVAEMMSKKFKLVTKMEIKSVVSNSISDAAALSVAAHLGTHDEEVIVELPEVDNENGSDETKVQDKPPITSRVCDMHNLSKILAWALGTLLKSKGKKVRY